MEFDLDYLLRQGPALRAGLMVTIQVSAIAIVLSIAIGLAGAAARMLRVPVLNQAFVGYVEFIRNTPLLVQIFFVFFGLPTIGLTLSLFWSGVLSLTLWAGAFQTENLRGGLATISSGLREASRALGLTSFQYLRLVGLPLAVRVSLPSILNTCVSLVKNSAYVSAIGLQDLSAVAFERIANDFRAFEMLSVLLAGYLALVLSLSFSVRVLEHRLQAPFRR
ncbi:MAG: amino acid transporter permease [Rubritepida sp.]|nr:amino acid transporter permease [Rubritepida sp.]